MIVSIETFNAYSGNYETDASVVVLKNMCLESAEKLVRDYLRYDPEEQDYIRIPVISIGVSTLSLPARHVTEILSVEEGSTELAVADFQIRDDKLVYASDPRTLFPRGTMLVSFTAGWKEEEMPQIISLTILRVATLMLMEMGENIGITGKSMPDNTRTFINYTRYDRYLTPLQNLRVEAF